jgi:hypothetical protein
MAAIDFPASPVLNQLFGATNGVVYKWDGQLWLAISGIPSSPGGDFMAMRTTALSLTGSLAVLVLNSVAAGNAGSWYNPATGRYTPPAGRHFIRGSMSTYNSGGTAGSVDFQLRKNGVTILDRASETTVGGSAQQPVVAATVDANGTDYFELMALTGASAGDISNLTFQAFPISGIKGPPGDPGAPAFRLLQRVVAAAAAPTLDLTGIPADINDLEVRFDITPVVNGQDLVLKFYDAAGALLSAGYGFVCSVAQNSVAMGAPPTISNNVGAGFTAGMILNYSAASSRVGNVSGLRGSAKINNIRDAARFKSADWTGNYVNDAGTTLYALTGSGWRGTAGAISGLQFIFGSSAIIAGSTMSVWGSP